MTILQANKFYFPRGGTERYVAMLTEWLERRGNTVVPFAMKHPSNMASPYERYFPSFVSTDPKEVGPITALRTLGRMFYSRGAKRKMEHLLRDVPVDIAHVHNVYTQLSASVLLPLRARRIPTVMTVHDYHLVSPQYNLTADPREPDVSRMGTLRAASSRFHKESFFASGLQAASYRFARSRKFYERSVQVFIVPCKFLQGKMVAAGFDNARIRVIPHGTDTANVTPRYDHDGYFLYIGRLSVEKGVDTVIDLAKRLPDQMFKIVGTGPEEARLHARAHHLPNVEFCGYQEGERLAQLLGDARAVLLPSRVHEVFPLAVLEAFAAGKPVIASHVGGVPEAVDDHHNGILVAPFDLHAWTEAVLRMAYDEPMRSRMARAAREAAETRFSLRKHFEAVEGVYAEAQRLVHG